MCHNQEHEHMVWYRQSCIKYFRKVFNLQISFLKYFNYFCQVLWTSSTKSKIILAKVIEVKNTVRSHCESINQSSNIRLINKKKHKNMSTLGIGTATVTVQYTVNRNKH